MIAAQLSWVLSGVCGILAVCVLFRLIWNVDQCKRHPARPRDHPMYTIVCIVLFAMTCILLQTEIWLAERYVEKWAQKTLHEGLPLQVNNQSGQYGTLLIALSKLQSDPPNHRSNTGQTLSCHLETNGRSLQLSLWQKLPQSNNYSVELVYSGFLPRKKVRVGMIQLDNGQVHDDLTDLLKDRSQEENTSRGEK